MVRVYYTVQRYGGRITSLPHIQDRVSALRQLEALLTRFFSNESTNEEKLEISGSCRKACRYSMK